MNRIIPVVKDRKFLNGLKEINPDKWEDHIFTQYNSDLYVFYVEDGELSIHYLMIENLNELNLNYDELYELAIKNLHEMFEIKKYRSDSYYTLTADGNYESSLILLDIWTPENFEVEGNIVIGLPARDLLMVTGSQNSQGLHNLYDTIEKTTKEGSHLVSDKLFEYIDGKFKVLQ